MYLKNLRRLKKERIEIIKKDIQRLKNREEMLKIKVKEEIEYTQEIEKRHTTLLKYLIEDVKRLKKEVEKCLEEDQR